MTADNGETASLARQLADRFRYEDGLARCSRSLIAGGPQAITSALEHLRAAAAASRVYLFENFSDPADGLCMRQTHETCAPGVRPEIENPVLRHLPYKEAYTQARELLAIGKPFHEILSSVDQSTRAIFEPQGILSILNIPVQVSGEWYGFIGFDDTETPRIWSDHDVRLLQTAAEMIGAFIGRERAGEELSRRQSVLDTIFRTVPTGIGMIVDRVFTVANERLCELTGRRLEDLLGKPTRILYADEAEFDRVGREQLAGIEREGIGTIETRWVRADGSRIEVLLSTSPVAAGKLDGDYLFAALDVTERAAAAREHRAMEAQVQHHQRLESLGVLAGGVAHDFNNLLMIVMGNIELVESEPGLSENMRRGLADMHRAARHGADLTRQLLAYAGKGAMVVEKVDVSAVIRGMQAIIAVSVAKKATVTYELAQDLPRVVMDVTQLRQIVMNLLVNASESLDAASGEIVVRTSAEELGDRQLAAATLGPGLTPGIYLVLEVRDTGHGMDAETRARIFDPFFSTKFPGRGLGLAAVHGIVHAHKGCMSVESTVGTGTAFRIMLPAAAS